MVNSIAVTSILINIIASIKIMLDSPTGQQTTFAGGFPA